MSRSVLLQLAHDSITEVLQAQKNINKSLLLKKYPLLNEKIATQINIYIKNELKGSSQSQQATQTLLEDIIQNAKKSAFEDKATKPITISQYLHCEIEIILHTAEGIMQEKDSPILNY